MAKPLRLDLNSSMLIPVILSGGAGTRLWPVSREGHPKPFMKLPDGETLLEKTYHRAISASLGAEIITVTNRDYFFMCKDELQKIQKGKASQKATFLLEPYGRNTAPAIAIAALFIREKYGEDACMLVLSADHLIDGDADFIRAVADAHELAENDYLATFGIVPDNPATGFGYIESGMQLGKGFTVAQFVEKPDAETAATYLSAGNFYWNAGMFCFKAEVLIQELQKYAPDVLMGVEACLHVCDSDSLLEQSMLEIPAEEFSAVPDISIDYALMERSGKIAVVPSKFAWSDIGSWSAVKHLVEPDAEQNRAIGEAVFVESSNTFVQSEDRVVAAVGVNNLMVIDTPDALLVAHPEKSQAVKQVVARLKQNGHESYKLHTTVCRPWGSYTVLEEGFGFKIKRIEVKPGEQLSLQMHYHRSEHWIVVSGTANVVKGDKEFLVKENASTFIPAGHKHRLTNPGIIDLVIIEVQSGEYLGEDDIVRFEDVYGRVE